MKFTGIGFHPSMIRARRAGRKNQTRRILSSAAACPDGWYCDRYNGTSEWAFWGARGTPESGKCTLPLFKCRYGDIGDGLYIKEGWAHILYPETVYPELLEFSKPHPKEKGVIVYRADLPEKYGSGAGAGHIEWKNGMFMPAYAARTTLEITDLKPERLLDMPAADAIREGAYKIQDDVCDAEYGLGAPCGEAWAMHDPLRGDGHETAKGAVLDFIDFLHGKKTNRPSDTNPWVWAIGFKEIK